MNYRPITDFWILGRCKHGYFGGYPAGFLERARILLNATLNEPIAHIPGGKAHKYNGNYGGVTLNGFGNYDWTIDIDPSCSPDIIFDVRNIENLNFNNLPKSKRTGKQLKKPKAILIDRPYDENMASNYNFGPEYLPNINKLSKDCILKLDPGQKIGILDWKFPKIDPEIGKLIATIAVSLGFNSTIRQFTVFEKL